MTEMETPVLKEVLYTKGGRTVVAALRFDRPVKRYQAYHKWGTRCVKVKFGEDNVLYIPRKILDDFVSLNVPMCHYLSNIHVDPASITYYKIENSCEARYYPAMTPAMLITAVERGCSVMRFEPNLSGGRNEAIVSIPEIETLLWNEEYSQPNGWKLPEIAVLRKTFKNRSFVRMYARVLEKEANVTTDAESIENARKAIKDYEKRINDEITAHRSELLEFSASLPERMLDCGFTFVTTSNEFINKCLNVMADTESGSSCLDVDFPDDYMSCSKSYQIMAKLRELSGSDLVNELSVRTELD